MTSVFLFSCTSVDSIKQNTDKLVAISKGQLDIMVEINKTNENVADISSQVNRQLNSIPQPGGGLIPEGMSWIFQLILIILGVKNSGQILGFARGVGMNLLKGKKDK